MNAVVPVVWCGLADRGRHTQHTEQRETGARFHGNTCSRAGGGQNWQPPGAGARAAAGACAGLALFRVWDIPAAVWRALKRLEGFASAWGALNRLGGL